MTDDGVKLLLGVCGAAQAENVHLLVAELKRRLENIDIQAVLTPSALKFLDRGRLESEIGKKALVQYLDQNEHFEVPHIQLARWADLTLIYPASANTIAKMNYGMCDNLLTNVVLASAKTIIFGPCMNEAMFENPITQSNIQSLVGRGFVQVPQVPEKVYIHADQKYVIKPYCSVASATLTVLKEVHKMVRPST